MALLPAVLAGAGCVAYEAQPVDPVALLRELDRVGLRGIGRQGTPPPDRPEARAGNRLTARQAAGWAVVHNPALVARRAELGIAEAELVRAGLLPDPVVGWDAMDAVAVEVAGGTPRTADHLAGLGLSWEVPRPGEIGARVGVALGRREEVRQDILGAEWALVRAVHGAFAEVVAARARLDLNARVLEIARRTATFFEEARAVRGATAIQESLAAIEVGKLEQDRVRLEGGLQTARQGLNRLLGLPPGTEVEPEVPADPFAVGEVDLEADRLVDEAVRQRPDLRRLLARYRSAEEGLRLEVARQWPRLAVGTGISLVLPIFRRLNRPAIRAAIARRERTARALRAAVHGVRAEVHAAVTALRNAVREVRAFEQTLVPRVQESLRLTDQAFRAREVTLVEILTAQTQVLDARSSYLEARIRAFRAGILVDTVTGRVLADGPGAPGEEKR